MFIPPRAIRFQVVDPLDRGPTDAADDRMAIAADRRISNTCRAHVGRNERWAPSHFARARSGAAGSANVSRGDGGTLSQNVRAAIESPPLTMAVRCSTASFSPWDCAF